MAHYSVRFDDPDGASRSKRISNHEYGIGSNTSCANCLKFATQSIKTLVNLLRGKWAWLTNYCVQYIPILISIIITELRACVFVCLSVSMVVCAHMRHGQCK